MLTWGLFLYVATADDREFPLGYLHYSMVVAGGCLACSAVMIENCCEMGFVGGRGSVGKPESF